MEECRQQLWGTFLQRIHCHSNTALQLCEDHFSLFSKAVSFSVFCAESRKAFFQIVSLTPRRFLNARDIYIYIYIYLPLALPRHLSQNLIIESDKVLININAK